MLSPLTQRNLTPKSRPGPGIKRQQGHQRSALQISDANGAERSASPSLENQRSLQRYLTSLESRRRQSKRSRVPGLSRGTSGRSGSQSSVRSPGWNRGPGTGPANTRTARREKNVQRSPFSPPENREVGSTTDNRHPTGRLTYSRNSRRGHRTDPNIDDELSSRVSSNRRTEPKANTRMPQSPFSPFTTARPRQQYSWQMSAKPARNPQSAFSLFGQSEPSEEFPVQSRPFRRVQSGSDSARDDRRNPWETYKGRSGQSGLRQTGFH